MTVSLNTADIVQAYRILGVSHQATLDELKKARARAYQKLHPDKHPFENEEEKALRVASMQRIDEAYRFIETHYEAIQETFSFFEVFQLTSRRAVSTRSHWIYSQIHQMSQEM